MRYIFLLFLPFYLVASTLYLTTSSNPSRINPLLATDSASSEISGWIFNGLVKYNKNGEVIGDLANSFEFDDNTTLIFKLKDNISWQDNYPFSVDDIIFTYNLLQSNKISTPYSQDFRMVKSLEKIDNLTLKVIYTQPYFKALHIWMMGIVPKHILENEKNIMTSSFNRNPIGTGPYKLESIELSKAIILKANQNYFEHKPNIDTIHYTVTPDPASQYMRLRAKQSDIGSLSPLQYERELDKEFKDHYKIVEKIEQAYTYLGFNLRDEKFKNPLIRKALSLAINKKEIVDILFFGHGQPCYGPFLPAGFAYSNKFENIKSNPEEAKKILNSLGYNEQNRFSFEVVTNSNNSLRLYAAQIMQYQLKKIGVDMQIRAMEWQAFLNMVVFPRKFEAVLLGWGLSLMPDAYSIWHSNGDIKGGYNFIGYHNKDVDRLIEEAQTLTKTKDLSIVYKKIFTEIVNDNPYIFLYIPNSITAINKKIKPIEKTIIGIMHNQIDWIKE